jgi:hypothetical protein
MYIMLFKGKGICARIHNNKATRQRRFPPIMLRNNQKNHSYNNLQPESTR